MGQIRAVPRSYRGVRFRSTLEADWAATLTHLDIAWQYEPEAVTLPSGELYRPDFYLPECETWLEVKGPHNDRLDKALELGEAGRHYPDCDDVAHEEQIKLLAFDDQDEAELAPILAAAPSGETRVTVERVEWIDQANPLLSGTRTLRTSKLKRSIALDAATRKSLGSGRLRHWWACCTGDNVPWRMVVIGRAPIAGSLTWESAQAIDVTLIRCDNCQKVSFFDETMTWICRQCRAGGKVYRGGRWESASAPYASDLIQFRRAPRNGE